MKRKDYLKILKNEIHTTVVATNDINGLPQTRVIDIMLVDEETLYFITAKGKEFYEQLNENKYISVSGFTNSDNSGSTERFLNKKSITIRGEVENIGHKFLNNVFEENPYMKEIYPQEKSREVLEVFKIKAGIGEFFDLSTRPITRDTFYIGDDVEIKEREEYYITDKCIGCNMCYEICPQKCIDKGKPYFIRQSNCLHCGNCISICQYNAVEKRRINV